MSAIRPRLGRPSASTTESASGRVAAAPSRTARLGRRALLAIVLIAIVANAAYVFADRRLKDDPLVSGASGSSENVVLASPIDAEHTLIATRDNVISIVQGGKAGAQAPMPKTVGAVAATGDGSTIYAGMSDGFVTILDGSLAQIGQVQVEGRVVGISPVTDGFLVAHGVGTSGNRYYVTRFGDPAAPPVAVTQASFQISALTTDGTDAVYGTGNARVARVDPAGTLLWETTLPSPIMRLLALPDGGLLAGGEDGILSRVDASGAILWSSTISQYPLRGLAFDPDSSTAFAGDSRGSLDAVDGESGSLRVEQAAGDSDLEAILPTGPGAFLVIPRQGGWHMLDAGALNSAELSNTLRVAWAATNGALVLAGAGAAIVAVDRWRVYTRKQARLAWRSRVAYVLALPAIALILAFSYYPAGLALYYSLTNFSLSTVTEFVGLDNYREILFHDRYFRVGLTNLAIIVVSSVAKTITAPLLVAGLSSG